MFWSLGRLERERRERIEQHDGLLSSAGKAADSGSDKGEQSPEEGGGPRRMIISGQLRQENAAVFVCARVRARVFKLSAVNPSGISPIYTSKS